MGQQTGITGLDHGIIGVTDLENARLVYEKLGFTITRRGHHEGWGTANYCIMFEQDYLEILGIVDPSQFDAGLPAFLEKNGGDGLLKIVARSQDVDVTQAYLADKGFMPSEVQKLGRWLEMPEGDVMPHFRLVHLPEEKTPGFRGFICQHLTPEIVWRQEWLEHPNTAKAVESYVICHSDPESLKNCYETLFNLPADYVPGKLSVHTGAGQIIFATKDVISQIFPILAEKNIAKQFQDGDMVGMIISVADIQKAADVLTKNNIPSLTQASLTQASLTQPSLRQQASGLQVAPDHACGVVILFTQETAADI